MVLISSSQIDELAHFCLESGIVEELSEVAIVWFRSEVDLEQVVDGRFEHKGVVDGYVGHPFDSVPAGLSSSCH